MTKSSETDYVQYEGDDSGLYYVKLPGMKEEIFLGQEQIDQLFEELMALSQEELSE